VTDPADLLAVRHVHTLELDRGATAGTVEIAKRALYRAELYVADEVGNETGSAVLLDASDDGGGGCRASPSGHGGGLVQLLLFGLAIAGARQLRRR